MRSLVVTATPITARDADAFSATEALQTVFLGGARGSLIRAIAHAAPHLTITNGRLCIDRGREAPVSAYYSRDRL